MKTLIFSDSHLTHQFDARMCDYTVQLVRQADRVILNGDFWDAYLTSFERFWQAWQPLLKELASRETIYLEGNHDSFAKADKRLGEFSAYQNTEWRVAVGKQELWVRHGHDLSEEFDRKHPLLTELFSPLYPVLVWIEGFDSALSRWLIRGRAKRCQRNQELLVQFAHTHCGKQELLVCGHTHMRAELPEKHYMNPGPFESGRARFIWVQGAEYELVEELY